jgi:hypothetical protein
MGVWKGVAMDSLKFHPIPPCPTLFHPAGCYPRNGLMAALGVGVFYYFVHPTPYAYDDTQAVIRSEIKAFHECHLAVPSAAR